MIARVRVTALVGVDINSSTAGETDSGNLVRTVTVPISSKLPEPWTWPNLRWPSRIVVVGGQPQFNLGEIRIWILGAQHFVKHGTIAVKHWPAPDLIVHRGHPLFHRSD